MYVESKFGLSGGEPRYADCGETRLKQLVSNIEDNLRPLSSAKFFSIFHARKAVKAEALKYREFVVWAGDMHGPKTFVVTIWADWVGDNKKHVHHVRLTLSEGTKVS